MFRKVDFTLFVLLCLAGLALGVAGCGTSPISDESHPESDDAQVVVETIASPIAPQETIASPTPAVATAAAGMPNPASVYCQENGGMLEFRQDSSGGTSGVCIFPDGSQCDEWAYFRGECKPGGGTSPGEATQPTSTLAPADYAFPAQIDPAGKYLFYLHGKIIEDQGLPAVSPDFGEYHYAAILQKLGQHGLRVISEVRSKDTDPLEYARRVADQVRTLLEAGVPAENITVLGASKGGGIAIYVSNLLKDEKINYVPMAICSPETVMELIKEQVVLYGNVLSVYNSSDELSGSCADLFIFSEGKGLAKHNEIILNVGTGHGILYQPLDEWVLPVVAWAGGK